MSSYGTLHTAFNLCSITRQIRGNGSWAAWQREKPFLRKDHVFVEWSPDTNQAWGNKRREMVVWGMGPVGWRCSSYPWAFSSLGQNMHQDPAFMSEGEHLHWLKLLFFFFCFSHPCGANSPGHWEGSSDGATYMTHMVTKHFLGVALSGWSLELHHMISYVF